MKGLSSFRASSSSKSFMSRVLSSRSSKSGDNSPEKSPENEAPQSEDWVPYESSDYEMVPFPPEAGPGGFYVKKRQVPDPVDFENEADDKHDLIPFPPSVWPGGIFVDKREKAPLMDSHFPDADRFEMIPFPPHLGPGAGGVLVEKRNMSFKNEPTASSIKSGITPAGWGEGGLCTGCDGCWGCEKSGCAGCTGCNGGFKNCSCCGRN